MTQRAQLEIRHRDREDAVILQAVGQLTTVTAPELRDSILKCAVEQPRAVIIDITELGIAHSWLLSVFSVTWMRINPWPATPLKLVTGEVGIGPLLRVGPVARSLPTYRTVSEALAATSDLPGRLRAFTRLPAQLTSAAAARRFVVDSCRSWPVTWPAETLEKAELVASELVENTVCHTPVAEARLRVEWRPGWLTVAVGDDDLSPAVLREAGDDRDGGLGLKLLSGLCQSWGSIPHPGGGKVVWAALRVNGAQP